MSPLPIRYPFFGERNTLQGSGRAARSKDVGGRGDVYPRLPVGVSNESVRAQVEKVLSSALFARCERLAASSASLLIGRFAARWTGSKSSRSALRFLIGRNH